MANIDNQLTFFNEHRKELLDKYGELFVVVSPDLIVNAFASELEAYRFGVAQYGLGNFLLKDCREHSLNQVYIINPTIAFV